MHFARILHVVPDLGFLVGRERVISEGQEDRQHAVEPENSEMSDRERRIRSMITTEDVDWADLMKSHKVVSSKDAD